MIRSLEIEGAKADLKQKDSPLTNEYDSLRRFILIILDSIEQIIFHSLLSFAIIASSFPAMN